MTQALPIEVETLGTPTAEYNAGKKTQTINLIASAVFALGGAGLVLAGLIGTVFSDTQWLCASGIGLAVGALGVYGFFNWYNNYSLRVLVSPLGVARINRGRAEVMRWDDVDYIWQNVIKHYRNGVYMGTTHYYKLQSADGRKLEFKNNIREAEKLGQALQSECTRRLFRRAAETYNTGGTLTFGRLSLSKQGLNNGKETLTWDQIKGVKLDRGIISIQKEGKWLNWARQTVFQTPNIFVFTEMIDQIAGLNKKK